MSTQQPEALRLADVLEDTANHGSDSGKQNAAAELRRLHELTKEWERKAATWMASPEAAKRLEGYRELAQRLNACEQQRDQLLDALKDLEAGYERLKDQGYPVSDCQKKARAAIAKATGQ